MKKVYAIAICSFLAILVIIAVVLTKRDNKRKEKIPEEARLTEELTEQKTEELIISDSSDNEDVIIQNSDTASAGDPETPAGRTGNPNGKSGASERVTYSDDGNTIYVNDVGGEQYDYSDISIYPSLANYKCEIQNASVLDESEMSADMFITYFYTFCAKRKYTLPSVISMEKREVKEDINNYVIYYFSFETSNLDNGTMTVDTTPFDAYAMALIDNGKIEVYDLTDDQ